jgi:hypothetical protein
MSAAEDQAADQAADHLPRPTLTPSKSNPFDIK